MPLVERFEDLRKLQAYLEGMRRPAEDTLQEVIDLFMPYRGDIHTTNPTGRRKPLYDSYGVTAADRCVNFVNGSLYPSSSDWIALRAFGIKWDRDIQAACDETSKRLLDAFAESNFYVASGTFTRDWIVAGNTTFMVQHDDEAADSDEDFGGLIFDPIAWNRAWWIFSHIGRPYVISREVEMTALDAYWFFQKEGDRLPAIVLEKYRSEPYCLFKFLHIVQRDPTGRPDTANKPWKSHWIPREGDTGIVRKGGFDLQPYIVSRMILMEGDQYGRGLGHIARPQAKGVNEIARQEWISLGKELNPPFMAEDDGLVSYDFSPGGHISVRPPRELQPGYLRSGTDFGLVETIKDNLHRVISDAFLGDALAPPEAQDRSAESTIERRQRGLVRVSGTGQSMDHELLGPTIETAIHIMLKRNALPELQSILADNPKLKIRPIFTSPFFTAQKAQAMERIDAFLEKRLQLFERSGEMGPMWLDDIDLDELRSQTQQLTDIPASIFKKIERIDEIRQARADRAAEERIAALMDRQTQVQVRPTGTPSRAAQPGTLYDAASGITAA